MASQVPNIPPPADQIRELIRMEHRIPRLLTLLSSALTALLPVDPDAPKVLHEDGSVQEEEERFVDSAKDYYQELDDVQLLLRSTIHHLRLTRVLPTPSDFVPPSPNQLPPTPFAAPVPKLASKPIASSSSSSGQPAADSLLAASAPPNASSNLGLYGLRVEAGSWRRLRDSLREMKGLPPSGEVEGLEVMRAGYEAAEPQADAITVVAAKNEPASSESVVDVAPEDIEDDDEMEEVPPVDAPAEAGEVATDPQTEMEVDEPDEQPEGTERTDEVAGE